MLDIEPRSILDKSLYVTADKTRSTSADLPRLERNALCSPLLRLSPEVRNAIYAYALGGYVIDIYDASSQRRHVALHPLETCRQIYIEARMIPFIRNTFFCPSSTTRMPWSLSLPGQVQAITTVSLHAYRGAAGTREQTEKSVDDLVLEPFTGLRRLELLFFNYCSSPGSLALEVKEEYPDLVVVYKCWNGARWGARP